MSRSLFVARVAQRLFSRRAPQRRSVQGLNCPETLEVRYLLSAVMAAEENPQGNVLATLDNGQLTITDIDPNGHDDFFVVNVVGMNLFVNDRLGQFIAAPAGGSLSSDGKTLSMPLSAVTAGLTIHGGLGDDAFRVDRLVADFSSNFTLDGGAGADMVEITTVGVNLGAASVDVTAEIIAVNAPVLAGGSVNLTSTGNDTPMIIAAPVTAGGDSKFASDQMRIRAQVDVGTHTLTLTPESTADSHDSINIGPEDDAGTNTLLISDTELDFITAGTIVIGDENTGTITVAAAIEVAGDSDIQVVTGRNIIFMDGSSWTTTDGALSFVANQAGTAVGGGHLNGIELANATLTSLGAGDVTLNGHGGNGEDFNVGVFGRFGSVIQSLGTGQIHVTGTGGAGTADNRGVQLNEVSITSVAGNVYITGQGGDSTGSWNIGVWLVLGANISTSANASITINGTGGDGTTDNNGVQFNGFGYGGDTQLNSENGDIWVVGHGPSLATDGWNRGIGVYEGAVIRSTGTSNITLEGTGGAGTRDSRGVEIGDVGTQITSVTGNIQVTGHGAANSSAYGVWVRNGALIESTGTAHVTLTGTGGDGYDGNGVILNGSGQTTVISSKDGDITIIGQGGNSADASVQRGVGIFDGSQVISTGVARITINGTGGDGTDASRGVQIGDIGTLITSVIGDIQITGRGGNDVSAFGVWMTTGAVMESTGTARIAIDGTGGDGSDSNGVLLTGNGSTTRVSSVDGDITITGHGGNFSGGYATRGVSIVEGSVVSSSGTAKIIMDGTGGIANDSSRGVEIGDIGTRITSATGDIQIVGQGGNQVYGFGVWVRNGAMIESTASAKITINGTGGDHGDEEFGVILNGFGNGGATRITSMNGDIAITGLGGNNAAGTAGRGFGMFEGAVIQSTGTARIIVDGTGGTGHFGHRGLELGDVGTKITSARGDILLTGHGGTGSTESGTYNIGVLIRDNAVVESTATDGVAAKIIIDGTGGAGGGGDGGIWMNGSGSVSSVRGEIQLTGHGATSTGVYNHGVMIVDGATVISTGSAKITVDGTAGGGASSSGNGQSVGAYVAGVNSAIQSQDGDIQITGVGGTFGNSNMGVSVQEGGSIESFGSAKILVNGTGGQGTADTNLGVRIYGTDTFIRSATGDIQVFGFGGTGTTFNAGVDLQVGGSIISTGTARINVTGIGGTGITDPGSGVGQVGVWLLNSNSSIMAHEGAVQITGIGGGDVGTGGNHGVFLQSGVIKTAAGGAANVQVVGTAGIGSTSSGISINSDSATVGIDTSAGTGNISLFGDRLNISSDFNPGAVDAGTRTVTIQPKTTGTAINLGGADSSGVLGLTDAELDRITAAKLNIGNSFAGTITVSSDITRLAATDIQLISGGDVVVSGGLVDTDGGSLLLNSGLSPNAINPTHPGVDASASTVTLGSDLLITINGLIPDVDYTQLHVTGGVDLNGVQLVLSGNRIPAPNDRFTIVNNDGSDPIVGTFQGLLEGTVVLFHGKNMRISYVGGTDGNDVVLTAINLPAAAQDGILSVTQDLSGNGTLTATDADSVSLIYSIVTGPSHGMVVITDPTTGAYTYAPNAGYIGPDHFTFKANDGFVDSNVATISITVNEANVAPELHLNGGPVTFSAKAARKTGPAVVVPNVTVFDPNVSTAFGIGGGVLTVNIDVSAKVTKKSVKLQDTIGGLSNAFSLGVTSGAAYQNGKLVLNVLLNASTTTADIQSFLRGITFKTKGPGLKQTQRILHAQLTDAAGAQSNLLQQTMIVTK